MDIEDSVLQLTKNIGSLEQRMESMEKYLIAINNTVKTAKSEEEPKFNYPLQIQPGCIQDATPTHMRAIQCSEYKVQVAVPFPEDNGEPYIFEVNITRKELDMYFSQLPCKSGEYIYKITPSYENYL